MTLRHNIALGSIDELNNDEKILKTIERIKLNDKLNAYHNKLDSQMGKWFGGYELSKGQWQRVAIGRTFYRNANVYILDEPTASLDPKFEKQVFDMFFDETKDDICLLITHRLDSIIKYNPRIIVFSSGEIVGDGTQEFLSKNNIAY